MAEDVLLRIKGSGYFFSEERFQEINFCGSLGGCSFFVAPAISDCRVPLF